MGGLMKESIGYVCDLLSEIGVGGLTPEILRQAKFDGPVVPHLWRALHDLIVICMSGFPNQRGQVALSKMWKQIHEERADDEIPIECMMFVANVLLETNFPGAAQWGGTCLDAMDSRELLLALGWVLVKWSALEQALKIVLNRISIDTPLPPYPEELPVIPRHQHSRNKATFSEVPSHLSGWSVCDFLSHRCQQQLGRVQSQIKLIANLQNARAKLNHKIECLQMELRPMQHCKTLSAYELMIAMHSKVRVSHFQALKSAIQVLEMRKAFQHHVQNFFEWMGSVTDEQPQAITPESHSSFREAIPLHAIHQLMNKDEKQCLEAAEKLHEQLKPHMMTWMDELAEDTKQTGRSPKSQSLFSELKSQIHSTGSTQLVHCSPLIHPIVKQPLPSDVRVLMDKWQSRRKSSNIWEVFEQQGGAIRYIYYPIDTVEEGSADGQWIITAKEEIGRVTNASIKLARQLAKIRAMHKRQLRMLLSPFAEDHLLLGF